MPTRAFSRVRAQFGGALLAATVIGLTPAAAAAQPADAVAAQQRKPDVRSLTGVPARVVTGDSFRVTVKVRNTTRRAVRPKVAIYLRERRSQRGREVGSERFSRIKAGKSGTERIRVRIPRSLAAGRYLVAACIGRAECDLANRRLTVTKPTTPPPNPNPVPNPPPSPNPPNARFTVLVFTETGTGTAEYHASTPAGVEAIRALGRQHRFAVSVTDDSDGGVFTEDNLKKFRAVIFLNTSGAILTGAQKHAFETYYEDGGGMLAVHGAIDTEPDWEFFTDLLGTRAEGEESALEEATIKVADRVHDASKGLPEYWQHADEFYNFTDNVRGFSHVLATVDEDTYDGGDMGADHPVAWCKDYQGGRSFYTAGGHTAASYADPEFAEHLGGAIDWAAGASDPVYSDCGATVLANYQQTKLSAPPNINEPIGFDQLPDGRILQTVRDGRLRLHDPASGTSSVIATLPVYTHSEDGLYGPAIDNDFAANKWVYLYYSPLTMEGNSLSGTPYPETTPPGAAPTTPQADLSAWDQWKGYFQLSRFKFVDGATPSLDLTSEQKIMKVEVNRGACCHVGGDIDFDKHNNLWLVTGDDTPAGGGNSGGWGPYNDLKTDETQTVRTLNATGGTFTITFAGQTTAPIAYDANSAAVQSALDALSNVEPGDVTVNCGANACTQPTQLISTTLMTLVFDGQYAQEDVPEITTDATGLTGTTPTAPVATTQQANLFIPPWFDARRSALNTNDLRGKMLRIKVAENGSYQPVPGNLFAPGEAQTRPEIYAMGFRNPFRIQVDSDDVAYTTDYSPDSQVPGPLRGPAGTGRMEIVRAPSNYGWPLCMTPTVPMYEWNFNTSRTLGEPQACGEPTQGPVNASRHNTGLTVIPPITQPDLWYSYQDPTWGTPCFEGYNTPVAQPCVNLFPELASGGVGPHGAAKYEYDPANPNPTKFPPYYDDAVFFGEFTRDTLKEIRLDEDNEIFKINPLLNCGAVGSVAGQQFECDNPMDMQFGADGAFYLLTYGDGFFAANPDAGMYKWEYVKGQRAPLAVLGATPTDGLAPLEVTFSSEGSRDPDPSDSIEFAWDFTNDGSVDSTDPNPTFTYTQNGVYTARLTVTDSSGKTATQTTTITVGNTSPELQLVTPVDGDFFAWGDDVPFTVTGTDPEDGPIDCSQVTVTFVLVHDQHGHGEDSETGCSGTLSTEAEDASHGGYIAGGISVSYTDDGANGQPPLTTTVQNVLQIRRQQLEYAQDQSGTTVGNVGGGEPDPGGGQIRNGLDEGDWVAINRFVNLTNMNKEITLRFAANGLAATPRATVEFHLDSPDGPLAGTGTLQNTGGNNAYTNQTFPLDFTGSRRVYLVFKAIPGNATTGNFGNLNWVEFSGAGHGVPPTP